MRIDKGRNERNSAALAMQAEASEQAPAKTTSSPYTSRSSSTEAIDRWAVTAQLDLQLEVQPLNLSDTMVLDHGASGSLLRWFVLN